MFWEKGARRNLTKFKEKHLCQSLFLIKLQAWSLQFYSKRDPGTGVFLRISRNFYEYLFLYNTSDAASAYVKLLAHSTKISTHKGQKKPPDLVCKKRCFLSETFFLKNTFKKQHINMFVLSIWNSCEICEFIPFIWIPVYKFGTIIQSSY